MDIHEYRRLEEARIAELPDLSEGYLPGTYRTEFIATSAGSTRILCYLPSSINSEKLPLYINLHGGGFVLGFPEVDDVYCRKIAEEARCVVVNVDYSLAPEHPFPSAVYECNDITLALAREMGPLPIDPQRIAIGGQSAGGNLAAAACLLSRDRPAPKFQFQVINYAVLDLATSPREKMKNIKRPDDLVEIGEMYNSWYLQSPEDARNQLASPLLAKDLSGLPPALVITAEHDILREEAEMYARRLTEAGVAVYSKMYQGCSHGFTHRGPREAAHDAWRLICTQLLAAFYPQ